MVLLDTCTLLWLAGDPSRLSVAARNLIADNAGAVFVSPISAWEIAIKSGAGKLSLPKPAATWYAEVLQHHGLQEIPISGSIATASATLPRLHNDPADRFLIATALEKGLSLITPDHHIAEYPLVRVVW